MPERICKLAHNYGGRHRHVGDAFEVEQRHVEIMLRLGRIEPQSGEYGYETRDMQAAPAVGYQTRDLSGTLHVKRPRKAA